jgi:protein-S-isoprenylcysteine O-methyltransferase Ste14
MPLKNKFPPAFLLSTIVIMVALHFLLPGSQIIRGSWRFLGLLPFILGNILNALADQAFKQHETTVKPFEESTYLVTDGVFRLSRNPMYLGFVLILVGFAVLLGSLTPWIGMIIFPFLMHYRFIRIEETMLEAQFGDNWLEYKQKVRRWF